MIWTAAELGLADRVAYLRHPEEVDAFWDDAETWGTEAGAVASRRFSSMTDSGDERVQPALHALLTSDVGGLRAALEDDPGMVNLRVGGNTMLEWMTQPEGGLPSPEMVGVLIDAGADLDRALNLAGCWNLADLCAQLLAAGADPAARADAGITPLESAAMHSSTEAADVLVSHGLHRPSLWLAAASGLLEEVREWVSPDGSLRALIGGAREV